MAPNWWNCGCSTRSDEAGESSANPLHAGHNGRHAVPGAAQASSAVDTGLHGPAAHAANQQQPPSHANPLGQAPSPGQQQSTNPPTQGNGHDASSSRRNGLARATGSSDTRPSAASTTAGFQTYSAEDVEELLPSAQHYPVAFLALDQAASTPGRSVLAPVFTNSYCRSYFSLSDHGGYAAVLKQLLKRDPLLSFALLKALSHLAAGELKGVNHVTPDPLGQNSLLYGLRLSPCLWRAGAENGGRSGGGDGGEWEGRGPPPPLLPVIVVEHNLPYEAGVVLPRLLRDYAVLSHVPAILTLIDFHGKVRGEEGERGRGGGGFWWWCAAEAAAGLSHYKYPSHPASLLLLCRCSTRTPPASSTWETCSMPSTACSQGCCR
jgi:hypothetical protein